MRRHMTALFFAFFAASAQAQSTNCQWIAGIWTCNTTNPVMKNQSNPYDFRVDVPNPGQAFQQSYEAARRQQVLRREQELQESYARAQAEIAQQRLDLAAQIRKNVGRLLADGDCAGAKKMALSAGELALANEVKAYCDAP